MWIVGFISSAMFVYLFFSAKIYAQSAIYVYYVLISVYGYFKWTRIEKQAVIPSVVEGSPSIKGMSRLRSAPLDMTALITISIILSATLGWVLTKTDSPIPWFDGIVAGFSIVATWMVTQKIIQHWYFWIGINLFCVPLYLSQGLYFTALMFLVYFIMSIIGLKEWKKTAIKPQ